MISWERKGVKLKLCPLFFLSNLVPFNGQSYQKRSLDLVTSRSSGHKNSEKFRKSQKNSFVRYILSHQFWWCNVKQFLSYSKNYICKFMQVSSWYHKLIHFHLSFWNWEKERRKKSQKLELWKSVGENIKIWWKIVDTRLKLQKW